MRAAGRRRGRVVPAAFVAVVVLVAGVPAARPATALEPGPAVAIVTPADGAVVSGTVEVTATTTGTVSRVDVAWSGDAGSTWTPVGADQDPADGWSVPWDTTAVSGPVLVEVRVDALTADVHTVTVDNTAPAVALSVNRSRFSPNGDGVADKVVVTVRVDEPVHLSVTVRRNGVVRTLVDHEPVGPGAVRREWNGANALGRPVTDGTFTLRADATDAAGTTEVRRVTVTADTRPPRLVWVRVRPEPQGGTGPVALTFDIRGEARPVTLRFEARDQFGVVSRLDGVHRAPGRRQVAWSLRYPSGTTLFPGRYLLAARARDDVGNVGVAPWRWHRVHRPVANRIVSSLPGAGRRVAITIDDCNDPGSWSRMLAILARRGVHASFFCIGANVGQYPELARRTVAGGHTIGSHTPDHVQVDTVSGAEVAARLRRDQATWWAVALATPSPFWRPPYGIRSGSAEAAAGASGFRWTMLWSIDPRDWERPGATAIATHVLGKAHPGAVILLHVLPGTADALDRIITGLRARGLQPVSLAELVHAAHLDRG